MLSFAYDNAEIINGLKRRGKAIIAGEYEGIGKHEKKIAKLINKNYD